MAKSEESRSDAADQLRDTETAISQANRNLRELAARRGAAQGELAGLEAQAARLNEQIERQQARLSELLYRQFLRGENDALQLLLAGRDPNQAGRDRHYLALLSKAQAEVIGELRASLAEKRQLAVAVGTKAAELADIERSRQQQRNALLDRQKERQAVLARISSQVAAQRRELDTLRRNEQRLSKLIEKLGRIVGRPKGTPPRSKSARGASPPADAASLRFDPSGAGGAFARLRGRLQVPVRGTLANRFGTSRADGGALWKGLFFRAAEGAEVHAVAAGQVVYADWLRGFGNLLIIDHGDDFLSVYGNNQSLLHEAGDRVTSGEPVATVGNSGGNAESGLYFELRYQGRPFDPIRWVGLR